MFNSHFDHPFPVEQSRCASELKSLSWFRDWLYFLSAVKLVTTVLANKWRGKFSSQKVMDCVIKDRDEDENQELVFRLVVVCLGDKERE